MCVLQGCTAHLHEGSISSLKFGHDLRTLCHSAQVLLMHSFVKAGDDLLLEHCSVGLQLTCSMLNAALQAFDWHVTC